MAPKNVEQQTFEIIDSLFEDLDNPCLLNRSDSGTGTYETDGADDPNDPFDAVIIAQKLRELGDDYDEKRIQPLINKLQQAAAEQAVAAFGQVVDDLCQSAVAQGGEVAPEMQLLQASVALGLYVKKRSPNLIAKVKNAMGTFLNSRLADWVTSQGGWDQVADRSA